MSLHNRIDYFESLEANGETSVLETEYLVLGDQGQSGG
jgi:hypothetical protein